MSRYIGKYVSTCDMCLYTKVSRQPPVRKLNPFSIPDAPWDTISVDFIVELPESEGKDAIMVVVDSVTKCGHFVDMVTTLSAAGTASVRGHSVLQDNQLCIETFQSAHPCSNDAIITSHNRPHIEAL